MENTDFVDRLNKTFEGATMAVVAKRLGIPHATVRNYYNGRLPAPEVLTKIAAATGVSLNWLLLGRGEMFSGETGPIGLGRFLELKIGEIIDRKLEARLGPQIQHFKGVDVAEDFDVDSAVAESDDPQIVMQRWFAHEGREYPMDYGVVFFRGWRSFTSDEKVAAVRDAKKVLDRILNP
jgi:transcriptional regulator with XRE-family HTH domain